MNERQLQQLIEATLMVADGPLSIKQMQQLFDGTEQPDKATILQIIEQLQAECEGRGIELKQVASGYRYQARPVFTPWIEKLWQEKPPRYSRAILEILVLIAYRQPITRAEIEEVRGVAVSSNMIRTLQERDWVKVVGQRDVPGKPELLGTTKTFLDYFNLSNLSDLPMLPELQDIDTL